MSEWVWLGLGIIAATAISFVYPKVRGLWHEQMADEDAKAMIGRRLADSDNEVMAAMMLQTELERGKDPVEAGAVLEPYRRQMMEATRSGWRPDLIGDEGLKLLCKELDGTSKDVFFEALGVHSGYTRDTFLHNVGTRVTRIDELKSLIRQTMGELGWITADVS